MATDKQPLDIFTDGDGQLALPVGAFQRVVKPSDCRLDPMEGFPVLWRYTDEKERRSGVVLNVPGLLNGGAMSISTRGWIYETQRDGGYVALFMPGNPKRMRLEETRHKVMDAESSRTPLYPAAWPKGAVRQVVRAKFSTIVILNDAYLLEQVPRQGAPPAPEPPPLVKEATEPPTAPVA
jgi:hypothetical protein